MRYFLYCLSLSVQSHLYCYRYGLAYYNIVSAEHSVDVAGTLVLSDEQSDRFVQ